jgi:hypothetical protein
MSRMCRHAQTIIGVELRRLVARNCSDPSLRESVHRVNIPLHGNFVAAKTKTPPFAAGSSREE